MTYTCESDLHTIKVNQHGKFLGQRLYRLKVNVWTHTNTTDQLLGVDHYSGQ